MDFKSSFAQFIAKRTDTIGSHTLIKLEDYKTESDKCSKLFHEIHNHLPHELQSILYDYEASTNLLQSFSEATMYQQGLKDGLLLQIILSDS
jgi:hypothetical protein